MRTKFITFGIGIFLTLLGLIVVGAVGAGLAFVAGSTEQAIEGVSVVIGDAEVRVEVADTRLERTRGLSERESLFEDEGMLFVFDAPERYTFWMKDMNFPIDIVWFDKSKRVVDITHNATPDSYPETFQSLVPAQYVLEVASGWTERHGVEIGAQATFSL